MKWKWFAVIVSPLLTALMVWGGWEIVRNYLAGEGGSPLWLVVLLLVFLGTLGLIFLGSIMWVFRSRVVIREEEIEVRGLVLTRRIRPDHMEGFRYIQGKMHLYLKDRNWPVQLAFYERQIEIESWVRRRTTDLHQKDLQEEAEVFSRDLTLGLTPEEKEYRLFRLRKIVGIFKMVAYSVAVAGVLNFLFLKLDVLFKITISALVCIPILLDIVALHQRGHVHVDTREGSRYPEIFSASMVCGVALALMSLLDRDVLFLEAFLRWFIPALLLKALIWLIIDRKRIRVLHQKSRAVSAITVAAFFLLPSFWVGGSLYQINKHLDKSPVIWNATTVLNKRISKSRTVSYVIKLKPWHKEIEGPLKVTVSKEEFRKLVVGEPAKIGVRRGALSIPWVFGVKPG
jgi:hypothetical protein